VYNVENIIHCCIYKKKNSICL